jgi:hypothetical protein
LEGRVARISPTGRVDSYELQNNRFLFYVEDVKKYYRYSNDKWEEVLDMCSDKRIWDKWMAPEVALAEGTNPTKQMYKFMKTLDMFKDCGDC